MELLLPAALRLHPLTWMNTYTDMKVMQRYDPSELGKHRDNEKYRLSKFCSCAETTDYLLAQTQCYTVLLLLPLGT